MIRFHQRHGLPDIWPPPARQQSYTEWRAASASLDAAYYGLSFGAKGVASEHLLSGIVPRTSAVTPYIRTVCGAPLSAVIPGLPRRVCQKCERVDLAAFHVHCERQQEQDTGPALEFWWAITATGVRFVFTPPPQAHVAMLDAAQATLAVGAGTFATPETPERGLLRSARLA